MCRIRWRQANARLYAFLNKDVAFIVARVQ